MAKIDINGGVAATTLVGDITSGSTTINVADGSSYPPGTTNFYIVINRGLSGEEVVEISARSGDAFTAVTRGADGTSPTSHSSGATVEHCVPALTLQEANTHANQTTGTPHGSAYVTPSGNVATATALETARDIELTGDVTGSASFDGSGDASIATTVDPDLGRRETIVFTASGTFDKASYPWARYARIRVIGGGGAGGGAAATSASEGSVGTGGGGGAYSESTIAVSSMSSSETVTVGAGGTGVAGGDGNDGSSSSFGTLVTANAGEGGDTIGPTTTTTIFANIADGGGTGGTGQIKVGGGDGKPGKWMDSYTGNARGGYGGGTAMASSQRPPNTNNSNGSAGQGYGAGGSGASNAASQATARTGGAGAAGIVIVELFGG